MTPKSPYSKSSTTTPKMSSSYKRLATKVLSEVANEQPVLKEDDHQWEEEEKLGQTPISVWSSFLSCFRCNQPKNKKSLDIILKNRKLELFEGNFKQIKNIAGFENQDK